MKSPFTGGEVRLRFERRELVFRKETFSYVAQFYECLDTKEGFTTTEMDEVNTGQIYTKYRLKYSLHKDLQDERSIDMYSQKQLEQFIQFCEGNLDCTEDEFLEKTGIVRATDFDRNIFY